MSANGRPSRTTIASRGGRALVVVFALLLLVLLAVVGFPAASAGVDTGAEYSDEELEFVSMLNAHRASNGLQPVMLSDTLSRSAQYHSEDMAKYKFFDHYTHGSDYFEWGHSPFDRMREVGYPEGTFRGENIAAGYLSGKSVFYGFKNSSGHNAVMLAADFRVVGVAQVYDEYSPYKWYWTVDFGSSYENSSAHESSYYQQTEPRITYLGPWSTRWAYEASGGSYSYASEDNAAALVAFSSTSVELIAKKGPTYGMMEVTLTDPEGLVVVNQTVNLYSATDAFKASVFTQGGLDSSKTYTLQIRCLGTKGDPSGGTYVTIDAIKIPTSPTLPRALRQAPLPVRHQQDDSAVAYSGAWAKAYTWSSSAGNFSYADSPGAAVNVVFDGTYLSWVAKKGAGYGKARVVLDGDVDNAVTVDLYSRTDTYKQRVYDTGLLSDGEHTLSIYWIGAKNPAAYGYRINADTFDVLGDLVTASAADPITWTYEQTDSRITYLGPWSTRWAPAASGGSFYFTGTKGAAALVEFTGTAVEVLAKRGPVYGKMQLTLDAGTPEADTETVDLYNTTEEFKASVRSWSGLDPDKKHTLTIKCLGDKQNAATSTVIDIDALNITGTMTPATKPTRFQESDPTLSYPGAWTKTGINWAYSGGTYTFSNWSSGADKAKVTVTFEGTYLAWVTKTSSQYGIAKVTLDAGTPGEISTTIDLYSSYSKYKQKVYETGLLDAGTHTLTIEWTGTKRTAATGTYIGVDTFDVLGTLKSPAP